MLTVYRAIGQTYWQVLAGRALSGIGSAGKIALASIVVAGEFPVHLICQLQMSVSNHC